MKTRSLDYRLLPGANPLFLDFLYAPEKVSSFYQDSHLSLEKLKARAQAVRDSDRSYPRQELADILLDVNRRAGASQLTLDNIERLRSPETVAILTGQQLGLFGGPSYTFHKAATAVRLACLLQEQGIQAVPVFWLPSNDSDLEEVRQTHFFDRQGELFEVGLPGKDVPAEQMVGPTSLEGIESCIEELRQKELPGQFASEVVDQLEEQYCSGCDFGSAYARWLARLFADQGLVLFDALAEGYQQLAAPVFRTAVEKRGDIVEALRQRALDLEKAGYAAQVHCGQEETLLFWRQGQQRFKIRYEDGVFQSKDGRQFNDDLRESLDTGCRQLGANVLLRPILQDHLFPTVTYVGGPSEVAYYSQIQAIAPFWDLEMAVFPRMSLTVVDRKAQRFFDKHGLDFENILQDSRLKATRKILEKGESKRVLDQFEELESRLRERLQALDEAIRAEDPPVADMLRGAGAKMEHQIERVRGRFVKNHEKRNEALGRHLDYLYSQLLPKGKPQERLINFNQYLALEGPTLVPRLIRSVDPFSHKHQVVFV
ncbi:MAG TPA: bacillithiol biosynthesis cysteine-adding enzyme BshC [Acidobacteriota bacterium]|nr:bacillithiol biosynthesis cysteine-adding enzyme BshC [Acidobacteriota bacterium]